MSFRVKDFNKNILAEFDTHEELESYISSSQYTSSISTNEESASLNYFQYDDNIHESLEVSMSLYTSESKEMFRITYLPGEDDIE